MTISLARKIVSPDCMQQTLGASGTAEYVAERIAQGRNQLRKSDSLSGGVQAALDELHAIADECKLSGWDGYEAEPPSEQTIRQAEQFLNSLPLGARAPSVGVEPDGQITFEWFQSPRRILSVSVTSDGDLHYAALLGYCRRYGTEPFFGKIPAEISRLIDRALEE
ncbi:MAG TPA: hypothetical protein VIU46_04680 [Gallionellaceae bacterium]